MHWYVMCCVLPNPFRHGICKTGRYTQLKSTELSLAQ